ncbi:mammalian cell entry protein [Mycobacterium spongiae]|uniref:Mammalian cell entry protein n=1 Tax=Mycobacterium spongiae TaxID=886343 RepID=A0A975PZ28_9MYCO|nr:mammalian cell entry protein [Mycobacterium spongiae]QUR69762.1 mammalian cell entry protein [Mycobacterium spongiae]
MGQSTPEDCGAPPDDADSAPRAPAKKTDTAPRGAIVFGLAFVAVLVMLLCWLVFQLHQAQQQQDQRRQFLQAARQGALNLTTIDWRHAEADVRRILDSATGEFYDDFAKRSQPFIEVLRQAKATTVGMITEAGLESETAESAEALVAVSVQTSNAGEPEPVPRAWRMRITVEKVGAAVKVASVGFVP